MHRPISARGRGAPLLALVLAAAPLLALFLPAPCAAQQRWGQAPSGVTVRSLGGVTVRCMLFGAGVLLFPGTSEGQQQLGQVKKFQTMEGALLGAVRAGGRGSGAGLSRVHSHLKDCARNEGVLAAEACRLARSLLGYELGRAEEQYQLNIPIRDEKIRSQPVNDPRQYVQRIKEDVLVPTWPCPLDGRFGLWGEGGKWVCLVHAGVVQEPFTVSIGSKGDSSFERDMYLRLNATIHTFDPTLNKRQQQRMQDIPFLVFHDAGLSGKDVIRQTLAKFPRQFRNANLLTVPQLFKEVGTPYIDIFKIDCEGCEYGVVDDMVTLYTRTTVPFGQILMEIHHLNTKHKAARELVAKIESLGYRMFHVEENAFYPAGYEMAFIHESLTRV